MNTAKELLNACASFEWRGPRGASLISIDGARIDVVRLKTDWQSVVGSRPVKDLRKGDLHDLFPSPSSLMRSMMHDFSASTGAESIAVKKTQNQRLG